MATESWCGGLRVGLVTGLTAEARIAARLGTARAGGGLPAGATAAAERLVAEGATALVSFGLCGGLDPSLRAGRLVVPRFVRVAYPSPQPSPARGEGATAPLPLWEGTGEGWAAHTGPSRYSTDAELSAALGGITAETLCATAAIAGIAEKRALFAATGASAVDLESGAVAEVAARHALPFAVLRAVCDTAELNLPPAASMALDSGGSVSMWRVAASVLAQPSQMPALLALARAATVARAALIRRVGDILVGKRRLVL
jgi:adenosylhomocysteine nucleosidase